MLIVGSRLPLPGSFRFVGRIFQVALFETALSRDAIVDLMDVFNHLSGVVGTCVPHLNEGDRCPMPVMAASSLCDTTTERRVEQACNTLPLGAKLRCWCIRAEETLKTLALCIAILTTCSYLHTCSDLLAAPSIEYAGLNLADNMKVHNALSLQILHTQVSICRKNVPHSVLVLIQKDKYLVIIPRIKPLQGNLRYMYIMYLIEAHSTVMN